MEKECPCVRVEGLNPEHSRTQMLSIHLCPDLPTIPLPVLQGL